MAASETTLIRPFETQAAAARFELSPPQLIHEINSLLDGALRSLRLARRSLSEPASTPIDRSEISRRLEIVHTALSQLADIVPSQVSPSVPGHEADQAPTLRETVRFVVDALRDLAEANQVAIRISIRDDLGSLPVAKLGVVLHNGLRNAIEACSVCGLAGRRVQIDIQRATGDDMIIMISDTGRGLPSNFEFDAPPRSDGHGHGLPVCRKIVRELGGTLTLMNVPFGGGAVMRVQVPLGSLLRT